MAAGINPIIILVRPQLPENVGAVARAMANFGLETLRLVEPLSDPLDPKALATSAGADLVLTKAEQFSSLKEAISDLTHVYGTCATERDMVKNYLPLRSAISEISESSSPQKVGIAFGPERTGLSNDDFALCRSIIRIPVCTDFSSLNLAQAVVLVAYEFFQSHQTPVGNFHIGETQLASRGQVHHFLADLETILDEKKFWRINHKKAIMWRNLQNIFTRMDLTEQEVRTLQGMIRSLYSR